MWKDRFPGRDLELLSVILSHPESLSSIHSRRDPNHIADEIARVYPDEAWSMVSRLLESDETHSFGVASWLGDGLGFEERSQTGAIRHFNPDMVMVWVLQNPKTRARKLLRCLPKTLDEQDGGRLTRLFLEAFGDHEEVADSLMAYFWSGGWTGPESAHLAGKRDKARQWISENKSGKVLAWLYRYIEFLNSNIAAAELREERDF